MGEGDVLAPIGEQPEVANAQEAAREHVQEEAAEEFVDIEGHDLHAIVVGVVSPAKPDDAVLQAEEAVVGEGRAVGVPAEIREYVLGTGEGPLGVDDPLGGAEGGDEAHEGGAVGERGGAGREGEVPRVERGAEPREVLPAEGAGQRADRKEKPGPAGDPARGVGGERAPGDQAVNVEMLAERLSPGVQDRSDAHRTAEAPWVSPEGEQRVRGGAEEQRLENAWVPPRQSVERMGECEDHMEVRDGQELRTPRGEPPFLDEGLALRTMAVAAGVVGEAHRAALITGLAVPAEDGGATHSNRAQRLLLDARETMRALIRLAVRADDVRQFEPGPRGSGDRARRGHGAHGSARRSGLRHAVAQQV